MAYGISEDRSVHDRQHGHARRHRREMKPGGVNMGDMERAISAICGAALAGWGLRRRDGMGALGIAAGAALILRGATGFSLAKKAVELTPFEKETAEKYGWNSAAVTRQSITIDKPRTEIYALWRNFENLPRFMKHVERVERRDDRHSHWVVKAPLGRHVEWDATVTEDRPNEYIAWQSDDDADIRNAGWVEFREAPAGQGTEVTAVIAYEPPGGKLGRLAAKLFGEEPGVQARSDLRRLKQMMEGGEMPTMTAERMSG